MTALLAAATVLLAFAAAWELAGVAGIRVRKPVGRLLTRLTRRRVRSLDEVAMRLSLPGRIERAGLARRLDPGVVIGAKLAGAALGALIAVAVAPAISARLGIGVTALLVAAGFLVPDALLERTARLRRRRFVAALPDALDMLAVGAASGRSPAIVLGEISGAAGAPLAAELGATAAEIECGRTSRDAIAGLRSRIAGAEVGALAATLERSQTYGSPLAEQLHLQATGMRRDARRRLEERASRAAPKIQLVVALVLVPSVLMMILAALIAHSDSLLGPL